MAVGARRRPACKLCCTDCRQRWNICQTRHGEGSAAASGLCATCGLRGTLAFAGGRRWPVWRLGAGRQPCVPTLRPAAAPEPCHRMSWYCEAPGCTRVDLHARCGLGSDVTAAPPRCPEARAGRRPADRAHSPSTTSPAPPHAPRGQQVHPTSTRRGGAVVVAVVGARQSRLSGWAAWSSTRVRGCEHAGCERRSVAADARNRGHICILHFSLRPWQRLSLHDAWVEYEPHPHGPSGERRFRLVETWCRGIFQRGLPTDPAPVALVGGPHRSRTAGTPPQFAFGGRLLLLRRVTALRLPKWAEMRRRRDLEFAVWSGPGGENRNSVSARLPSSNPVTRDARGGGLGPRNEAPISSSGLEVPRRPASLTCTGDRGAGDRRSEIPLPTKPADQAR